MNTVHPLDLTLPRVRTLPDIPGGAPGLIPRDATYTDLKVEFDLWSGSDPTEGKETVELLWNGASVARREWLAPIAPADLYVLLPLMLLYDGSHVLRYKVTRWDGNDNTSGPITLSVDKTAPLLAGNHDPLHLPADLIGNRVTAQYLRDHGNVLSVSVPAYGPPGSGPSPGDILSLYWETSPAGGQLAASKTLSQADLSLAIDIPGELIVERGDGPRYASYQVKDRAGNFSSLSRPVQLEVKTAPINRQLPAPRLKGTTSTTLNPLEAINGVSLVVPPEAVIDDSDRITLQWAEPDSPGAWRTDTAVAPREYRVPGSQVPQHVGRDNLPVYYEVLDTDGMLHPSATLPLRVSGLQGLPALQCERIHGGQISIQDVEQSGGVARCSVGSWSFMAVGQYLTVKATGVGHDGQLLEIRFVDAQPVLQLSNQLPIGQLTASDLRRFQPGPLSVEIEVSFDDKRSWQRFKPANATLVQ